ncbi:hypothetical protein B0T17DRAFT_492363 [Bombardia bombarda]|uniref:FAD-binding domain-containing protein n=1 Tax=Bombardia bombarda TaxID=252184 RepID=A0AA39X1J6_9PEZI|nr:hypothetical protein B0T17DRAFT_492363 [Bombardia bombarda]
MAISKVIIVGAGPSGLLLALLLARAGITVELLEMTDELDKNPRASHYTPESCLEFDRAGILDQVRDEGFSPNGVSWRKLDDKTRLVALYNPDPAPGQENEPPFRHRMVCLPLHRLGKILETAVLAQPSASILYGYKVVDHGQDVDKAWVEAETPSTAAGTTERREADYIVGCDGANSIVRRRLFGDWVFPGFTWDKQIVATNMYYDFSPYDYDDSQFFVHPDHWHMVAKIQTDGLCRVTYGEIGGLGFDELKARQPAKFQDVLPGNPTPEQYELVNFSPYKVHQRCAEKMRVGRFLLAADAAHLCNPFGGLGLTGGIADVGSLCDSLVGIHTGQADDSILDKYDEMRRKIWHDIINPQSSDNMRRLYEYSTPEEAMDKDPFFKMLKGLEDASKKTQAQKEDAEDSGPPNPGMYSLRYDMTQHYN